MARRDPHGSTFTPNVIIRRNRDVAPERARVPTRSYRIVKRVIDLIVATALVLVLIPVLVPLLLIVWASMGRSAFTRETMLGRGGRPFERYLLRTTRRDAPSPSRFGRLLCRTRLDELPQLWNVIRGEMSLIGPRPQPEQFYLLHGQRGLQVLDRLTVRPGLVGLTDIDIPIQITDLDIRPGIARDLFYVRHAGARLDTEIALRALGDIARMNGR